MYHQVHDLLLEAACTVVVEKLNMYREKASLLAIGKRQSKVTVVGDTTRYKRSSVQLFPTPKTGWITGHASDSGLGD